MTNDEIRIAVAEEMGWRDIKKCGKSSMLPSETGAQLRGTKDDLIASEKVYYFLPNYPSDLNACVEFEKALHATGHLPLHNEHREYLVALMSILNPAKELWDNGTFIGNWGDAIKVAEATALQRCEAFLRVKGKWVEGSKP